MLTSNQCKQIVSHLLIDCQWEEEKPVLARGKIAGTAIFFDRSKQTILPAFKNASFLDNQHDFAPDEQSIFDYYTVNTSLQVTQPPSPAHCTTCICRFHTVCIRQPALSLRIGKLLSLSDEQSQHNTSQQYLFAYIERFIAHCIIACVCYIYMKKLLNNQPILWIGLLHLLFGCATTKSALLLTT